MDYEVLVRFLLATLWGGIVGAEREYRSKSAGFRTMIMISIGACFFTIMSTFIGATGNPDRIASNIVTGIGFLGAGVIFRGDNRVNGITTAATIWAVAAVGMGIGGGRYFASACASILILVVLALLPYVERFIDQINLTRTYTIQCTFDALAKQNFENMLSASRLRYKLASQVKEGNKLFTTWEVRGHSKNHVTFITALEQDKSIERFEY